MVKDNLAELENRKQYLEQFLKELTLYKSHSRISEEMIASLIEKSTDFIRAKNMVECKQFIISYIHRVNVYADHVEILFNINVPQANETLEPLATSENIKTIQQDYKHVS